MELIKFTTVTLKLFALLFSLNLISSIKVLNFHERDSISSAKLSNIPDEPLPNRFAICSSHLQTSIRYSHFSNY